MKPTPDEMREAVKASAWSAETTCSDGHVNIVKAAITSYFGSAFDFCDTCEKPNIRQKTKMFDETGERVYTGPTAKVVGKEPAWGESRNDD